MGPIGGRQEPGGPHVVLMNFVIWESIRGKMRSLKALWLGFGIIVAITFDRRLALLQRHLSIFRAVGQLSTLSGGFQTSRDLAIKRPSVCLREPPPPLKKPRSWVAIHSPNRNFENYKFVLKCPQRAKSSITFIVYSSVCSGANGRKYQSSASLALVRGIHKLLVDFR